MTWFDADGDRLREEGELGMADVQITVVRDGTQVEQAVTDGDGTYRFVSLRAGEYVVRETQPESLRYSSTTDEVEVTLAAGQQVTVDFGDWDGIPLWLPMILR